MRSLGVVLAVVANVVVAAGQTARPNFAGDWILDTARISGPVPGGMAGIPGGMRGVLPPAVPPPPAPPPVPAPAPDEAPLRVSGTIREPKLTGVKVKRDRGIPSEFEVTGLLDSHVDNLFNRRGKDYSFHIRYNG